MRQPNNAAVLDRAHFLNALFLRKSFSWTAVMMDLETVLPTGVLVTSIEPQVTTDGQVVIRLRVAGERDRAVQLVRNLERSRRFLEPRLGSESAQNKENGPNGARPPQTGVPGALPAGPVGVEFEILANYNPLPANEPYSTGHEHATENRSEAAPQGSPAAAMDAAGPAAPHHGLSRRGVYPANGVVLPPYAAAASSRFPSGEPSVAVQRGGAQ